MTSCAVLSRVIFTEINSTTSGSRHDSHTFEESSRGRWSNEVFEEELVVSTISRSITPSAHSLTSSIVTSNNIKVNGTNSVLVNTSTSMSSISITSLHNKSRWKSSTSLRRTDSHDRSSTSPSSGSSLLELENGIKLSGTNEPSGYWS